MNVENSSFYRLFTAHQMAISPSLSSLAFTSANFSQSGFRRPFVGGNEDKA